MDCDSRVLAPGRSASAYGDLLIRVGERRDQRLIAVAAFGEPVSFLESRIKRMVADMPRWRWAAAGIAALVAIAAIAVACEAPRPMGPIESAALVLPSPTGIMSVQVLTNSVLDERPEYLSGPIPVYPELLRRAGVEGRVLLQAIVDTTGRVDTASLKVLSSPNPGFNESARQWLSRAIFRPARVHGRIVRSLVNLPIDFKINREREKNATVPAALKATERHADFMRRLAREYEPNAFVHPQTNAAIALIVDSEYRVVAHSSGSLEPNDKSVLDVLKRLLPNFRNTRFPAVGCMDCPPQGNIALYWGQLANR
jgi:TonB family protein